MSSDTNPAEEQHGNEIQERVGSDADANNDEMEVSVPVSIGTSKGTVGIKEGIQYGISLIVYIVGVVVAVGILGLLAFAFVAGSGAVDNAVVTAILGLFGFIIGLLASVVSFAGFAGLQYKIIADGVNRGTVDPE